MVTLEKAKELLGFIPRDPYYYDFFLEHINEKRLEELGEEWLKEHRGFIKAAWEYVETLL